MRSNGLIEDVDHPEKKKNKKFRRTPIFDEYVGCLPAWQREIKLRTLEHKLGMNREGVLDYLITLGGLIVSPEQE